MIGKGHRAVTNNNFSYFNGWSLLAFQEVTDIQDSVTVPVQDACRFLKMHFSDNDFSHEQRENGHFERKPLYCREGVLPIFFFDFNLPKSEGGSKIE